MQHNGCRPLAYRVIPGEFIYVFFGVHPFGAFQNRGSIVQRGECPILCVRGLGLQVVREAVHQPVSSTKYFAAPRNLTFTFSSMGTRSASESACAGP